jgi:hypothetical protein
VHTTTGPRRRAMGIAAIAALVVLAAGCERQAGADPGQGWPVAAAGRACQFLDYTVVATQLGVRFDTAGGAHKDDTLSCALTQADQDFPDLVLTITPTLADEVVFTATVIPGGATEVSGLGLSAYQVGVGAKDNSGPGLEVGWLSVKGRLMALRYRFAPGASGQQVTDMATKLVALAKIVEHDGPVGS